jgi:hypothetical protein
VKQWQTPGTSCEDERIKVHPDLEQDDIRVGRAVGGCQFLPWVGVRGDKVAGRWRATARGTWITSCRI